MSSSKELGETVPKSGEESVIIEEKVCSKPVTTDAVKPPMPVEPKSASSAAAESENQHTGPTDSTDTTTRNGTTNAAESDKAPSSATTTVTEPSTTAGDAATPTPADNSANTAPGSKTGPENAAEKLTPYSYTSRGEFTSENFKIEIRNMPRYYGVAQFKKFLTNTLKLKVHKLKPLPGRGAGIFVTLHDEASRQEALKLLDGRDWKKARLSARPAAAVPDPLLAHRQKRRQEDGDSGDGGGSGKKPRQEAPLEQRARDAVVPWWNVPYEEQLRRKRAHVSGVLAEYKRTLRKQNFPLFKWMEKKENAVSVEAIRPSPETDCYRNKCEFSVGFHPDTGERVVGFRLAAYRDGSMAVAPLDALPHVSERMRTAAGLFQRHVRQSRYAPFNALTHEGHWRQLLVRTTRGGDLLLSAQFHPQQLTEAELTEAQEELRVFMTEGPGAAAGVTSLYWQTAGRLQSGQERPHQLLAGQPHITETLCGLQLQISPDAFFQVNTAAAEVLYDAVGECAELDADTALLDVCCGTGSIGLALAGRARAVLGLELVESAVADAKRNAEANGITNSQFFAGRAEALLRVLLEQAGEGRAVAVVDPPRAGLGREVTQTLRRTEGLKRVVYVACDVKQALRNLLDLARPESNQYVGYPFVLRRLVPIDLFPQTPHVEVVALLERCDPELWRQTGEAEVPAADARGQEGAENGGDAEMKEGGGQTKEADGETKAGNGNEKVEGDSAKANIEMKEADKETRATDIDTKEADGAKAAAGVETKDSENKTADSETEAADSITKEDVDTKEIDDETRTADDKTTTADVETREGSKEAA